MPAADVCNNYYSRSRRRQPTKPSRFTCLRDVWDFTGGRSSPCRGRGRVIIPKSSKQTLSAVVLYTTSYNNDMCRTCYVISPIDVTTTTTIIIIRYYNKRIIMQGSHPLRISRGRFVEWWDFRCSNKAPMFS